jgi:uncharacterized protein
MRLVGIEEHVNRPSVMELMTWQPEEIRARLLPSVEQRIADMDAAGISVQVLSAPVTAPGPDGAAHPSAPVMPLDESAIPMVQGVNEELYRMVSAHPDRFSTFATLPVGLPDAAAAPPPKRISDIYYTGAFAPAVGRMLSSPGLGSHMETALHVTRLIVSGVFERIPGLKIIVGHLGEGLAFYLHRLDRLVSPLAGLPKPISQYLTEHFWYTTSSRSPARCSARIASCSRSTIPSRTPVRRASGSTGSTSPAPCARR